MDFDLALFLMKYAMKGPNKLYLHTKRLKQIRNQWHRDDPCLTAVIVFSLFILGTIYGLVAVDKGNKNILMVIIDALMIGFRLVF